MTDNSIEALQILRERLVARRRYVASRLAGRGADRALDPKNAVDLVGAQEAIEVVDRAIADEVKLKKMDSYKLENLG